MSISLLGSLISYCGRLATGRHPEDTKKTPGRHLPGAQVGHHPPPAEKGPECSPCVGSQEARHIYNVEQSAAPKLHILPSITPCVRHDKNGIRITKKSCTRQDMIIKSEQTSWDIKQKSGFVFYVSTNFFSLKTLVCPRRRVRF